MCKSMVGFDQRLLYAIAMSMPVIEIRCTLDATYPWSALQELEVRRSACD